MDKAKTLGLALIGLGFIETAWVLFCIAGGFLLGLVGFADDDLGVLMWAGGGAYGLLALINAPIALLHIVAGLQLRKGRGLILAMAALAACLMQFVFALYCFPFELLVLIYGLVVLGDGDVRAALEAGGDA